MSPRIRRWVPVVVVGAAGCAIGLHAEWLWTGFDDVFDWLPDLVAGWVLMGCGLAVWWRRSESRVGWLLIASGFAWFVGNYAFADVAWVAWIGRHGFMCIAARSCMPC